MMKAMKAKSGGESKKKKMSSSQNVDVTEITRSQRYREGQEDQLGALGLVVNMIALWNTIYMEAVLEQFRKEGYPVNEECRPVLKYRSTPAAFSAGARTFWQF